MTTGSPIFSWTDALAALTKQLFSRITLIAFTHWGKQ